MIDPGNLLFLHRLEMKQRYDQRTRDAMVARLASRRRHPALRLRFGNVVRLLRAAVRPDAAAVFPKDREGSAWT